MIDRLRDAIRFHAHLYYNLGRPEISDATYDRMIENLKELEKGQWVPSDSPTQLVGQEISVPLRDRR